MIALILLLLGIDTGDPDVPDGSVTGPRKWWQWI